ncbi:BtrH N-terminal domain-containing protein [Micromonospora sp. L32]|uniref:BtrH N-terminal domain-containing protein n=1 Tax=Micromonospora sp. L32 TaxID=3452214 RepID=UPI003F8A0EB8
MTEQKKLKQRVRARMAATGESWTTARRQVLAHAEPSADRVLPPGLVPGYRTFGPRQHRESGLLAHVLAAQGVRAPHTDAPYTEAMLAGLGGGVGFMYAVFEYRDLPPLLTIVAQHHPQPWVPAALDRLGLPYVEEHSSKAGPAIERLRTALGAGRPVFATVDRSRLPWHGLEPGPGNDPYPVVVAGVDGDVLHLDDEGPHPRQLPVQTFAAAWSAHRKGRHQAVTVTATRQRTDLPTAIRDAVATTVAHLTGPVLHNSFDTNFGFSGMAKLAHQLRDTRTRTGWARRFGAPVPFFHGVRRLYECLEVEYTAPGATRPVYADFLDEAAPLVGDRLTEAAALFRHSGEQWSRLAALALDTVQGLGAYTEVAEQRMALVFSRGRDAEAEIRELTRRLAELTEEFTAEDQLGAVGRQDLFAAMADLVESCLESERHAVTALAGRTIGGVVG